MCGGDHGTAHPAPDPGGDRLEALQSGLRVDVLAYFVGEYEIEDVFPCKTDGKMIRSLCLIDFP